MDRAGFAVLMVLITALARIGGSDKGMTGVENEHAGAGRPVWDQQPSRERSQGHSPRGPEDGASSRADQSLPGTFLNHSGAPVRLPRDSSSHPDRGQITKAAPSPAAGASREQLATAPRDRAQRTARHPVSQQQHSPQHRTRVSRRQSKPSSASSKRFVGPNVCGGQQCCSGWAVAPGTNRCIKPDCQPPCQNRGSCSRPHTCVCRSGFQGPRCEEVAPEQVYIRDRGALRRVEPGNNPFQKDQQRRRPSERQAVNTVRAQTPRPGTTRQPLQTVTQVRRGPPDSSPQQTGTSRTVKRYPSSAGPITSNALPSSNGYSNGHGSEYRNWHGQRNGQSPNTHRPTGNGQLHGQQYNNVVLPAGANLTSNLDRIKIVFTPMLCRRVCSGGRCHNSCEKGDTTTVYSESQQQQQQPKNQGFRLFFCQIPCLNGGRCIGRDLCWCPSNSTGKFCHLPVPTPARPATHSRKDSSQPGPNSHSMYTLPLSNQQVSLHPSLVNVHIQHPPEAEVQVHQVARVRPGQRPTTTEGAHSVQQRSQPGNGNGHGNGNGNGHHNEPTYESSNGHPYTNGNGNGHARPQNRQNGYVGRCFQETVDGQCGKPLPGLTKQDDCCGSVGASWGLNKCQKCPTKPAYAVIANGQVECPKGYKRMNLTHCQDINECLMPGLCKNAECLNTKGSYRCTCKPGYMLDAARSHCVSDKAVSDQREMCYRSVSAGTCSLPLSQHITKQICCCSRVGKAWGTGCERCPLPESDHFKEICPAGHGYTYSRSDVQISLRQLEEDDLRGAGGSWEEQSPVYPQPPSSLPLHPSQQLPTGPQYPSYPQAPQVPQYPLYPETPQAPQYPLYPETPQAPQYPLYPETPQGPRYPHTPQQPLYPFPNSIHPASETPSQPEDVEILSVPTVVTDSPLIYPETSDSTIVNLRPETEDTAPIDSATKATDIDKCAITPTICGHGKCIPVQTGYTCYCEPGYKLSALQTNCIDVNECEEDPCEGKGQCVNTFGSYTCQCYSGYSQVITQKRKFCQDINECSMPNKCQDGECVNTEGSYTCECKSGYAKSWRGLCEDVDECRDPSSCHGVCVNTPGSFHCQACGLGFRSANGRCVDVNECLNQTVCGLGRCVNTEGSYRCNCFQGYELSLDNICQDVDECVLPGACLHGRCVNLDGTHKCTCNHGYQATSDSKACEDVNECAAGNMCPAGICINTEGSYTCQNCRPGFGPSADGLRCDDLDECAQGDLCLGGVCTNTEGSYMCTSCQPGYTVSQDQQSCEDIDECQSLSTCVNGICLNSEGSYTCNTCPTGYKVSYNGEICQDIDECALPTTCPEGTCTNTDGSFTCVTCKPGFRVSEDGQQCDDVDECLVANMCPGQLCENTLGSYTCRSCGAGRQLSEDGYICEDIDECQNPGVCPMGVCTNTEGSFSCMTCDPGFTVAPNGLSCEDVNECEDTSLCLGGQCTNTRGSYSCSCPTGLELVDGTSCRDVDECLTIVGICGEGDCLNTEGSYICICPDGYTTISGGIGCQDVDECSRDSVCIRGHCRNTEGSYMCSCETGFKFNPETADCEDQNECKEFGSSVCGTWRCENTIGSYRCFMGCQPGVDGEENVDCDIDECVNETICGNHGFCENTDGSFRCQCDQGYTNPPGDLSRCVDINECEMSLALCGEALCENFDGSFLCICTSDNEEFDPLTSQCRSLVDMSSKPAAPVPPSAASTEERKECYYNLNDANFCDNVLSRNTTKQECCCTVGTGWGDNCEIHVCPVVGQEDYNQLCPHGGGLLPQIVSSSAQSFEEHRPSIDVNECEMFGPDICKNGQCFNLFSTYTCYCRSGFYYDNIRLECVDYDECEMENVCLDGVCVNTAGSFNCFCSPPLVLDGSRRRCINTTEETLEPDQYFHMEICWQELVENNMCADPLPGRRTTYTECCCLYGLAWGEQCALCPRRESEDYAVMCNLPRRGGSDSLRERPGYEYSPEEPEVPLEPYSPPYWDGYDAPESVPLFTDNDYNVREPPVRVPVHRPREFPPRPVDSYADRYDSFEGLRAEECGILNGCENGRCVRVREGYTCDCFDGFELDLNKMACIDINECEDISDKVALCQNGQCTNTEGSYKCTCLPGFVASAKPHECIPAIPPSGLREAGN
ncbi:latent-transforming growth factor beta-binding protein 2-like isoform X2 [Myripristis murdjan]|uniref:latent-transforming growth factor beta-binding protein 2-like isoform X2 n=1 Tax=Myripristis murdjan TaxID=586833 RepID=UPI0011763345|nr:latent-transforming growth factor beta-binding protein 2 isoform X2 [Myripristis murdjan]